MRSFAVVCLLALGLGCPGCGSPTREAAAEEHVTRALDDLAMSRPELAAARLETALRLDPASARAGALLQLVRPREPERWGREGETMAYPSPSPCDEEFVLIR